MSKQVLSFTVRPEIRMEIDLEELAWYQGAEDDKQELLFALSEEVTSNLECELEGHDWGSLRMETGMSVFLDDLKDIKFEDKGWWGKVKKLAKSLNDY